MSLAWSNNQHFNNLIAGPRKMLRQNTNHCPRRTQGAVFPGTPANLQACYQTGSQAVPHRGMCWCTQGGVHQVQDQPQEGQEACDQEVVLHSIRRVGIGLRNWLYLQNSDDGHYWNMYDFIYSEILLGNISFLMGSTTNYYRYYNKYCILTLTAGYGGSFVTRK